MQELYPKSDDQMKENSGLIVMRAILSEYLISKRNTHKVGYVNPRESENSQ